MRYCKTISDGYIRAIGTGAGVGEDITEAEYNTIMSLIHDKPEAPAGYGYHLRTDLTFELYALPAVEDIDPELTGEEALDIILGGSTNA